MTKFDKLDLVGSVLLELHSKQVYYHTNKTPEGMEEYKTLIELVAPILLSLDIDHTVMYETPDGDYAMVIELI